MADPAADQLEAQVDDQPNLRPEPYMGFWRRYRIKGDDLWTIAIHWAAAFLAVLFVIIIVFASYYTLPKPKDASSAGTSAFSEQRALRHVTALSGSIGARPYGSIANRVLTRDYIVGELTRIQAETGSRISFKVKDHPGQTPKDFHGNDWQVVWESMGNIVVRIHASLPNMAAFLVSGHYDTVFLSPGATDNTAGISSMLEMIEVLAHDAPAKHELIFAFVNGEEFGLLGAADLSRFDADFTKVAAFLNVDGTPGTKQLNFRSTGGWLDQQYASVPRPLAFVVAKDLFGSGIVDSDTDWSVYAEQLPGLDFATFSHRQTYHTMKDTKLAAGLLQFQGDNMLALIRSIAKMDVDSLWNLKNDFTGYTYFSFLNKGYAVWNLKTNYTIHVMLLVAYLIIWSVLLIHRYVYWKDLGMGTASNPLVCLIVGGVFAFASFIAAFGITSLFGFIATLFAPYFSYTGAGLVVFAFFPITIWSLYATQWFLVKAERYWATPLEVNRHRLLWGTSFCWWWVLVFTSGASKKYGSTYLIFFMALFHLISVVLHHVFFFFGVLNERPQFDMYEIMENAERKEEMEDEAEYEATGSVTRRRVRPVEHQRWRATYSSPDLAWYCVFAVAMIPSMLFFLDVMLPFIQMGAGDFPAWLLAPIVALVTFFFNLNFLPLSRRGHHYGFIASVFVIISVALYIFLMIGGATTFTANAPLQVIPAQVGDRMTFSSEYAYSYPLKQISLKLAPEYKWSCEGNRDCTAKGFSAPPIPSSNPIFPPHGYQYAANISSPNAWIHTISFPQGTSEVYLNGIQARVDPHNSTLTFMLGSYASTTGWTVEYNGPIELIGIQSYWDDLPSVPSMPALIDNLPDWATFKGRGSWLASQKYDVLCL